MSSAKQIDASRRNAQKSKGPRTAAGKARASCNSQGSGSRPLIIGECATVLGCVQAESNALIEQLFGGTTAQRRTGRRSASPPPPG